MFEPELPFSLDLAHLLLAIDLEPPIAALARWRTAGELVRDVALARRAGIAPANT